MALAGWSARGRIEAFDSLGGRGPFIWRVLYN